MTLRIPVLFGVALAILLPFAVRGDVEERHYYIRVGSKFPEVTSTDDQGKVWNSASYTGKKALVLFFYEGDFMTNCTKQTREMQIYLSEFRREGAEVVGVSGDTVDNHQRFKKANFLTFPLLSDPKAELTYRLGVARSGGGVRRIKDEKGEEFEVRRGMTPGRWTFVVDREGTVVYKKMGANSVGHAKEILAFLRKMNAER
jgi:thioredoxin-dependent peroxiredoxin